MGGVRRAQGIGQAINKITGDPGEIRTPDPQIRSLMLYPAELRGHNATFHFLDIFQVRVKTELPPFRGSKRSSRGGWAAISRMRAA